MKKMFFAFSFIIPCLFLSCLEEPDHNSNFLETDSARLQRLNIDSIAFNQAILKTVIDTMPLAGKFQPTIWKDISQYKLHIQGDTFYVHATYYLNGFCSEISCTNSNTDRTSWRAYYQNGKPRITGFYGSDPFSFQIGKWAYYSEEGKIDSIVDMDKKYTVSYFDAERSALKRNWLRKEIDIQLQTQKGKTYWQVIHWITEKDGARKSDEQLEVDVNSGKEKIVHNHVLTVTDAIF